MTKNHKIFLLVLFYLIAFFNLANSASAHATPIDFFPKIEDGTKTEPQSVQEVKITFSEAINKTLSAIRVYNEQNQEVPSHQIITKDPSTLSIQLNSPLKSDINADWFVVSQNDGHFTRGTVHFNSSHETPQTHIPSVTVEHDRPFESVLFNSMEFFGFVLLSIGALFLFNQFEYQINILPRIIIFGLLFIIIGNIGIIGSDILRIISLNNGNPSDITILYLKSFFGFMSGIRLILALLSLSLFAYLKNNPRISALIVVLTILSTTLVRGFASHAFSQGFEPVISALITWVHLLAKSSWIATGITTNFILYFYFRRNKSPEDIIKTYIKGTWIIIILIIIATLSGGYMVWLHLKAISNILTTEWGVLFIELLILGGAAIFTRTLTIRYISKGSSNIEEDSLQLLMAFEVVCLVVLSIVSATITQTSPPTYIDQSLSSISVLDSKGIYVNQYPNSDNLLITLPEAILVSNFHLIGTQKPIELNITPRKISATTYLVSRSYFRPDQTWNIVIQARDTQNNNYYWEGSFNSGAFGTNSQERHWDFWAKIVTIATTIGLLSILLFIFILKRNKASSFKILQNISTQKLFIQSYFFAIFIILLGQNLLFGQHGSHQGPLATKLRTLCENDKNIWENGFIQHRGVIDSFIPFDGCTIVKDQSHITDLSEYLFFIRLKK